MCLFDDAFNLKDHMVLEIDGITVDHWWNVSKSVKLVKWKKKTVPVSLCLQRTLHGLTWDRNQPYALKWPAADHWSNDMAF